MVVIIMRGCKSIDGKSLSAVIANYPAFPLYTMSPADYFLADIAYSGCGKKNLGYGWIISCLHFANIAFPGNNFGRFEFLLHFESEDNHPLSIYILF
jgi:hypothetical protein